MDLLAQSKQTSTEILSGLQFWNSLKELKSILGKAWTQLPLSFGVIVYPPEICASDAIKV